MGMLLDTNYLKKLKAYLLISMLLISSSIYGLETYNSLYFDYLNKEYNSEINALMKYAERQGFQEYNEQRLTVFHELIHLDQAKHQGFKRINKGYSSFYLSDETWGYVNCKYFLSKIQKDRNNIYEQYLMPNENLVLGNLIDELNVYVIMLPYFKQYADNEVVLTKQYSNIAHFLKYINMYLKVIRMQAPKQYEQMKTIELKEFLKDLFIQAYTDMDQTIFSKVYEKNEVLLFLR